MERKSADAQTAVCIAEAVEDQKIPYTRVGIFVGKIIEAPFKKQTLRFGNTFSAASRREELCAYFGTTILMDRRPLNAMPISFLIALE